MSKPTRKPPVKSDRLYTVGDYWLVPPDAKYTDYGIKWYDSAARQTRRVGTGETNLEDAKDAVKEYALKHGDGKHKDELVLQSMERYFLAYGQELESEGGIKQAIGYATTYWPDVMVSAVNAVKQRELVASLRDLGLADSTVTRHLSVIFTSIAYAIQFNHLNKSIMPAMLEKRHWGSRTKAVTRKSVELSKRELSPEEWGRLFDASMSRRAIGQIGGGDGSENDHCLRYLLTAIGTHGRPTAVAQITAQQINMEHGVIDLNPPRRIQNQKRRPIVPMAPTLAKWVARWALGPQEPLFKDGGVPTRTLKAIESLIRRAKIPDCTPYTFRHSVASWLAGSGIGKWERKRFLGHAVIDGGSTDKYAHYDPRYLRNAAAAIERLFETIAPHTRIDILLRAVDDQGDPDGLWATVPRGLLNAAPTTRLLAPEEASAERLPTLSIRLPATLAARVGVVAWQLRGRPVTDYSKFHVFLAGNGALAEDMLEDS